MKTNLNKTINQTNVTIERSRDNLLTQQAKDVLTQKYLRAGESYQDCFARTASYYADDIEHAQRLYDYISKLWFMPATPVLAHGGAAERNALPISCFITSPRSMVNDLGDLFKEIVLLSSNGGGIGVYCEDFKSTFNEERIQKEKIEVVSDSITLIKTLESMQEFRWGKSVRKSPTAVYISVSHPDILEFINLRKPHGGDPSRKALNVQHGILITNDFMEAVNKGSEWNLIDKFGEIVNTLEARDIWRQILSTRVETGEPYIAFIDHINDQMPEHHKKLGLTIKCPNLCTEVILPIGKDHKGNDRTASCCLSSVNVAKFMEWKDNDLFIEDCMRFLDNVLQDFINKADPAMTKSIYSATQSRSVGLGALGLHTFYQQNHIPFNSVKAEEWNDKIFSYIRQKADLASIKLGEERGPCPDAEECGLKERFSHKLSVAPNAWTSMICGVSPGINPIPTNAHNHKSFAASHYIINMQLEELIKSKITNQDQIDQIWTSILQHNGSIQQLDLFSDDEKELFKTAYEIDQKAIIKQGAVRQKYIDQTQSLNLFMSADVTVKELHDVHMLAYKLGINTLYYLYSMSINQVSKTVKQEKLSKEEPKKQDQSSGDCEMCSS